jgi:hypothetical protein
LQPYSVVPARIAAAVPASQGYLDMNRIVSASSKNGRAI